MPFWYRRVVREHLTKTPCQVSKAEVVSILNYLRKEGGELSIEKINRLLSGHTVQQARRAGLIKLRNRQYPVDCPYCSAAERQFKGGFSHKDIQVFRCGECRRRYPRPDYASIKTGTRSLKRYSETLRHKAVELYQAGDTFAHIGRLLSVPRATVFHWCKS